MTLRADEGRNAPASTRARLVAAVTFVAAVAVGIALRAWQLGAQILVEDEWHAVQAALSDGYLDILTSFGETDRSIPLTLLYRGLVDSVGLTELRVRLPSLLAGVLALLVIPALARREIGDSASKILVWLLAISPMLVFYSRLGRPYSLVTLLVPVCFFAFLRWWTGGPASFAALYVACAGFASWLLLVTVPLVLSPILSGAVEVLRGRGDGGRSGRELLLLSGLLGAALLLVLGPPIAASSTSVVGRMGQSVLDPQTAIGVAKLLTGTSSAWLATTVLLIGGMGAMSLRRARCRIFGLLAMAAAVQVTALVVVLPKGLRFPIVAARYLVPLLPLFLLVVARGLHVADDLAQKAVSRAPSGSVSVAVLLALAVFGPLPWIYEWPNNFTNSAVYQADYDPNGYFRRFEPPAIPAFYRELAARKPGEVLLLEAPWHLAWYPFPFYQRVHRQRVKIGFADLREDGARAGEVSRSAAGVSFANGLHVGDEPALRNAGVDYVIFHKDLERELPIPFAVDRVEVAPWIARSRERYGPPVFEDDLLAVFRR